NVFTKQLVMFVAEFVMSIALFAPGWIAVFLFYIRLNGQLQSGKSAIRGGSGGRRTNTDVPTWRTECPDQLPLGWGRKLHRKSREGREKKKRRLEKEWEKIERERMERKRRREERRGEQNDINRV
ncbi:hypothetical protein PENTCL1PPCAC_13398, partial [Pristionchus entomophagus]